MAIEIQKTVSKFLNLPRRVKTLIAVLIDFCCIIFSVWISYYLRLGDIVSLSERGLNALAYSILIAYPIFSFFGLYKTIFRYSGLYSLLLVSKATCLYGILYFSLISLIGVNGIPRTIGLIQPVLLLVLISSWRIILKFFLSRLNNINKGNKKTINSLVYGSGAAGRQLVRAMQESSEISIRGFLDDDINQQGCQIDGKLN